MTLEEVKANWNKGLARFRKAEKVAEEKPLLFEKYLGNFHELCREMSALMYAYEEITGHAIPGKEFDDGFEI
ncbi:MAG: hypothetical protein F8N39_18150 [Clostridiaceae bacterium]|nr:hypothetical protein [Clostridiaceae bacterium]